MLAVRLAPARLLVAGSVVAAAIVLLDIWLAWSMPWLGLAFAAPREGDGIAVERVFDRGPTHGVLRQGDVITVIELDDGTLVPLSKVTLSRATYSLPTYAAFNRFFADHRALWRAINQEAVTLVRADGTRSVLHPQPHRPAAHLAPAAWILANREVDVEHVAVALCSRVTNPMGR